VVSNVGRFGVNIVLLVLVCALWGLQYTFYKVVGAEARPVAVSFAFVLLSGSVVFPFFVAECWRKRGGAQANAAERSFRRLNNIGSFLIVGIVGATASSLCIAWGVARSTASNGALLGLTTPVLMALLAALILHERMTPVRWVSLAIALTGVLVLSMKAPEAAAKEGLVVDWRNLSLFHKTYLVGNLLLLLGSVGGCLTSVFSKDLLRRFSVLEVTTYTYVLTILANGAIVFCFEPSSLHAMAGCSARALSALVMLGVNGGLTAVLWLFLVSRLQVGQAAVALYLAPIFGVLEAAIFLHEQITVPMIAGGAITLMATVLVTAMDRGGADTEPRPAVNEIVQP
jgi:drug/metabolite transporter (DMT)-like permease